MCLFDNNEFIPKEFFKTAKELCYYKLVNNYYKGCDMNDIYKMIDIINGNSIISLRILDWFITKYSKLHVDICIDGIEILNINILYKAQLKSYKKRNFDPFRRRQRFFYSYDINNSNKKIETTLGQLNFFRWAISIKIINYIENHIKLITKTMNISNKNDKQNKKNKKIIDEQQKQLQNNLLLIKNKNIHNSDKINITLSFD